MLRLPAALSVTHQDRWQKCGRNAVALEVPTAGGGRVYRVMRTIPVATVAVGRRAVTPHVGARHHASSLPA